MEETQVKEGTIPLTVPSIDIPCFTYYKIIGDIRRGTPLVVLHGGPGSGHEYMLPYAKLWTQYGIPLVFYDQIGCASSAHIRQKAGVTSFWNNDLFIAQLDNLLDALHLRDGSGFDILGHSWGGMLTAAFASRQPRGLRRIVLASAISSVDLWEQCGPFFRSKFSPEARQAIDDTVRTGNFDDLSPAFKEAESTYLKTFWCRVEPMPAELQPIIKHETNDPTVNKTMYGPSPLACIGTLKGWSCIPLLSQINVPTLVYNGEYDLARDSITAPFFDHIPRVRWVTVPNASHMMHVEGEEILGKVLQLVSSFLRGSEGSQN